MALPRLSFLAAAIAAACTLVPAADAAGARPPVVWLKGEGNFTKSHRHPESIDKIVVHVTEGAFWGSVRWLQSPRAHASSHYIVGAMAGSSSSSISRTSPGTRATGR